MAKRRRKLSLEQVLAGEFFPQFEEADIAEAIRQEKEEEAKAVKRGKVVEKDVTVESGRGEDYDDLEEEDIVGGVVARTRCPLCGMVGDVYKNAKHPSTPSLEGYPYRIKGWRMKYGGFRWDKAKGKRVGLIKYFDAEGSEVALAKLYLVIAYDLCKKLIGDLIKNGVELSKDVRKAVGEVGSIDDLWADVDSTFETRYEPGPSDSQ